MSEADSQQIHHYRDGEVVLYKRERSSRWQARLKLNKEWYRISTYKRNLKEAAAYACDKFDEAKFRTKYDMPQVSRRFSGVAKLAAQSMQAELDAGMGKSVYQTYLAVINLHLVPYFGKHNIDSIKPDEFNQYFEQLALKQGKKLSRSTITNHIAALNRIYDLAYANGWITKSQIPALKNKGKHSNRRPAFTAGEYMLLVRRLREWTKGGVKDSSRMMRKLLQDYVLILANTGMRHGTESYGLKWKHLDWHVIAGEKYLRLHVNGKTGLRQLICRHNCVKYFKRIQSRFESLNSMTFDELLNARLDEFVFRLEDGRLSKNLNQNFEAFLRESDLLQDPITEQNRTLYSLRHTYATFALTKDGMDIYDLAIQMGTSVPMIEQHYSHLTPSMKAPIFAGRKFDR